MLKMKIENWKFYKAGKMVLEQERHARDKVQMDAFYEREVLKMNELGISVKRD